MTQQGGRQRSEASIQAESLHGKRKKMCKGCDCIPLCSSFSASKHDYCYILNKDANLKDEDILIAYKDKDNFITYEYKDNLSKS